jgi:putative membrane protein
VSTDDDAPATTPGAPDSPVGPDDPVGHGASGVPDAPDPAIREDGPRRTHPLTPLLTGWKVIAGVVAVIAAQNLAQLVGEFTVRRALLGAGALVVAFLLAIGFSALVWWRTTYEVDRAGVTLRSGLLTRTGKTAPRERIESVSVERPAVPRLLGLAKVRVEFAGGSDSYLDIDYVSSADAEEIRTRILDVAGHGASHDTSHGAAHVADGAQVLPGGAGSEGTDAAAPSHEGAPAGRMVPPGDARTAQQDPRRRLRDIVHDGVTDGDLIAEIPTVRLLHSMLRDVGWLLGLAMGFLWILVTVVIAWRTDGAGVGLLAAALPAVFAIPQALLHRIEGGWGFVSRDTERGLRMRRGLFSTRTDNLGAGRVQDIRLRRPLLWRGPGWTEARVSVAGIGEDDESAATSALPVGTRDELLRTLGHLLPPLGTDDDARMIDRLLSARARDLGGIGPTHRLFFLGRRTRRVLLLPGALVLRSGLITPKVQIVPRERIQGLSLAQGPIGRMTGTATLTAGVAATSADLAGIALADLLALEARLRVDAAHGRRYREQQDWPRPPLGPRAAASTPSAASPQHGEEA